MKKVAVVIDSFSGLYKHEVEKHENVFMLSLQIDLDGNLFDEGLALPTKEIIEQIRFSTNAKTSLPSLYLMEELIKKLSKEYEHVIFLPIAKHMSGTHDALSSLIKKHKNMMIFNTRFVGDIYLEVAKEVIYMLENGKKIEEVVAYIEDKNQKTLGFIVPDSLVALINSGRLTGIKKHIISSSNFSLIIKVADKLGVSGIGRSKPSAIKKVFNKLEKFCSENVSINGYVYKIVFSYGEDNLKVAKKYMEDNKMDKIDFQKSSLSTYIHTGYGAIYIGVTPNKIKK